MAVIPRNDVLESPLVAWSVSVIVPIGLAVVTWLVFLLTAGTVLRINSFSLLDLIPLVVIALMFWPIAAIAPWYDGVTQRVLDWVRPRRPVFPVIVALFLVTRLPLIPDLVVRFLNLPFRVSGIIFGASVYYRQLVGDEFAAFLLRFGQLYLEAVWLYILASGIVLLIRRGR